MLTTCISLVALASAQQDEMSILQAAVQRKVESTLNVTAGDFDCSNCCGPTCQSSLSKQFPDSWHCGMGACNDPLQCDLVTCPAAPPSSGQTGSGSGAADPCEGKGGLIIDDEICLQASQAMGVKFKVDRKNKRPVGCSSNKQMTKVFWNPKYTGDTPAFKKSKKPVCAEVANAVSNLQTAAGHAEVKVEGDDGFDCSKCCGDTCQGSLSGMFPDSWHCGMGACNSPLQCTHHMCAAGHLVYPPGFVSPTNPCEAGSLVFSAASCLAAARSLRRNFHNNAASKPVGCSTDGSTMWWNPIYQDALPVYPDGYQQVCY